MLEKFFKLKENGTDAKTEILAGITTFMTMAYILAVNPSILAAAGMDQGAVFTATALAALIGTLLMAVCANYPFALAPGMGLNAYFAYTVVLGMGYDWQVALTAVFVEGIVFIVLSLTNVREAIFNAIPKNLKAAVSVGIGLFIAFLGLQDAGIIVPSSSTCVNLTSFNLFNGNATWAEIMPKLVTIAALIIIAVLSYKKVKGSVLWGILGGTGLYYILGCTIPGFYKGFAANMNFNPFTAFGDWGSQAFLKVFTDGFDFSGYLATHSTADLVILMITTALAFCMVDMFDTLGTLYGACSRGNMLTEEGEVPNFEKAMLSDAIATVTGAICGTSTVTTFVESSAGVAEGARTGLAAFTTGVLFFVAMFLSPVAVLIPTCATSAALIYVGVLMMGGVADIEWHKPEVAVPSFMTIAMMPFAYNISYGIAFGLITYVFICIFTGRVKEIKPFTWVVGALFAIMFFMTH